MQLELRDRDVRNAMRDLALATNEFDVATTGGLPETQGASTGDRKIVNIQPLDFNDDSPYDDPDQPILVRTATVKVTIIVIDEDPATCDDIAERLQNVVTNQWNRVSLAGLTYPDLTRFTYTRWLDAKDNERRIEAKFIYSYEVGGFSDFGTEE